MRTEIPFDHRDLVRLAGALAYERGSTYLDAITGRTVGVREAHATVEGSAPYLVDLAWSASSVGGSCTCPAAVNGAFCKHQVALGLSLLDGAGLSEQLSDQGVQARIERDPIRAGVITVDPNELVAEVQAALRTGGFVDYRRSFAVAETAEQLLDRLVELVDDGQPDAARPALERMVSRLRTITEHADDSGGAIGSACQRTADLHARACREGNPDPAKLARWLLKFRLSTPGWPRTPLASYAAAFDDRAWRSYREGVSAAADKPASADDFEVDQMQLELLDHDGDVDGAVNFLARDAERIRFGAIIDRLVAADRVGDAMEWLDRAIAAGRIWHADDSYHRSFDTAARMLSDARRYDDAINARRLAFARNPGPSTLAALQDTARPVDRQGAERDWAMQTLAEQATRPHGTGAALIEIALAEGDLDAATAAAERFGAGDAWERLARSCMAERPGIAAELYQGAVDRLLQTAKAGNYRLAVGYLTSLREIYRGFDRVDLFDDYAHRIREENVRRPRFLAEFDRALRLPVN